MKTMLAALALGLAAPSAFAQSPASPATPPPPAQPAAEAPEPARLAAAQRMVDAMMPPGMFRRAMSGIFGGADSIFDMNMGMFGAEGEEAGTTLGEASSEGDPHFRERMRITNEVSAQAMNEMMIELEPEFRTAFVRYYALRFTVNELDELAAFFTTPTGRKYSEISSSMTGDPAFMQGLMVTLMPRIVESSAGIEERIRAATAHLPPPPGAANAEEVGED